MAKNDIPTKVIPFLLSEEDVKKRLYETLVDTDYVPTDIFDALSIGHVSKVYLPMYRYNGTFNAYWSCTAIYRKERTVGNKTEYYNEYQPASGTSTGGFDILCLANEGSIMPSKLRSFTSLMDYEHSYWSKAITYERWLEDFKEDDKIQIYPANKDEDMTWNSPHINNYIDRLANSAACRQAPFNHKDFSMTWNCNASRGELILVGFWMIEYSYRGNPCYYIVDGIGFNKDYSVPIDKEEKGKVKQVNNKLWLVVLACLLFCGIGLYAMFGSFYDDYSNVENGGLLLVISSIISLILLCVRLGKIKKDIKETARQERNAGKLKYCKEPTGPGRIYRPNNNVNLQICIAFVLMVLLANYTFTPKAEEVQDENDYEALENNIITDETVDVADDSHSEKVIQENTENQISELIQGTTEVPIQLSHIYNYPTQHDSIKVHFSEEINNEDMLIMKIYRCGEYLQSFNVSVLSNYDIVHFLDVNFDGYTDIFIGVGGLETTNVILVWNSSRNIFEDCKMLSGKLQNPYFDVNRKVIYDSERFGIHEFWYFKYVVENEQLTLMNRLLVISDLDKYNEKNEYHFSKEHPYTLYHGDGIIQEADDESELPKEWQDVIEKVKFYDFLTY